jgi:hypothetical protein
MIDSLVAGDTLDFVDSAPDYPATDGWTLKYRLIPLFASPAQSPITLAATTSGADYRVQVLPASTSAWTAGTYSWARWVERTNERYTLDPLTPFLTVLADPSTAAQGYDPRGHARKVLDAIEAVLENRASLDQEEYAINGRSLRRTPVADLLKLRDKYRAEVWRSDAAEKMAAGMPNPRNVFVRFGRA